MGVREGGERRCCKIISRISRGRRKKGGKSVVIEEGVGTGGSAGGRRGCGLAAYSWRARKASRRSCLSRE